MGLATHPAARRPLATDRLLLRPPDAGDCDALAALANDAELARRLARLPHPYTADDARFFLDHIVPAEPTWAVTRRGDGALLGMIGLAPDRVSAELGYWLGRAHWGQGFATEAGQAVVAHALGALGLQRLTSGHFTDNPASGHVLAKLGFTVTGTSLRPCLAAGGTVPAVELALARADWLRLTA